MQKALKVLLSTGFILVASCTDRNKLEEKWTKEITQDVLSTVMPKLVQKVMTGIKTGGHESAVKMCAGFAPVAEERYNQMFKKREYKDIPVASISFKRTALRIRNPQNKPDSAEHEQLAKWHAQEDSANTSAGGNKKIQTMAFQKGDTWYGMAPIRIINDKCLACHGTAKNRDKKAYKKIQELYPEDQAIGFELGKLRGAVSVKVRYSKD